MRHINTMVIHCSATKPNQDIGAKEITAWHKARGFSDIGYHFVIRRDGRLETGRPLAQAGAHVAGHNANSIGICLVGGLSQAGHSEHNFQPGQWVALKKLLLELRQRFPGADICGHRDYPGVKKDCPCFDVKSWLQQEGI